MVILNNSQLVEYSTVVEIKLIQIQRTGLAAIYFENFNVVEFDHWMIILRPAFWGFLEHGFDEIVKCLINGENIHRGLENQKGTIQYIYVQYLVASLSSLHFDLKYHSRYFRNLFYMATVDVEVCSSKKYKKFSRFEYKNIKKT